MKTISNNQFVVKVLLCILILFGSLNDINAQAPGAIPYQGVARDASGAILPNQSISLRFTLHNASATGAVVFSEEHNVTTTALGLFNLNIGDGAGTPLSNVDWSNGEKYLQVELDPDGGANSFLDMGTTKLNSVPYALHAANANSATEVDPQVGNLTEHSVPRALNNVLQNGSISDNGIVVAIGTGQLSSTMKLRVFGQNTPYGIYSQGSSYGVYGYSNSSTGYGVRGQASSNNGRGVYGSGHYGVYGESTSSTGYGVRGQASSNNGRGVYGSGHYGVYGYSNSSTGYGVRGQASSYATGGVYGSGRYGVYGESTSYTGYGVTGTASYGNGRGVYGSGRYGVYGYTTGSGYAGYFNGRVFTTANYQTSDDKLKSNIQPLENATDIISRLNVKSYNFKTKEYAYMNLEEGQRFGFLASNMKEVLPQLTRTTQQPIDTNNEAETQKATKFLEFEAVNYVELIPVLTKALQEQQAQIEILKAEVESLKRSIKE